MAGAPGRAPVCSVVVCTFERAASLARTLACLAAQEVDPGLDWEVIVVDNNSADDTPAAVEAAAAASPVAVRYAFEPAQGLSHARNRGLEEAAGDIIAFTDDDVCPAPDWLQRIHAGMETHRADACGGYIAPEWEAPPPAWLTERFHGFLAVRMDEEGPKPIAPGDQPPYGANMAFRRQVFERVGRFDVDRGRKGAVLASGEDGELFARILDAGLRVVYLPDARVRHRIEAFRLRRRYFRRWRYQNSRNIAERRSFPGERRVLGIPLYLFNQLLRAVARAAAARLRAPPDEAFFREVLVWHLLGVMAGLRRAARARGGPPA